ncbi:efflux RND transporter periplasmic adaptor subunit [Marinimicrobium sp. ABcell2]|uniref:efflux RND transporter periplasmic adaptor subunit n=1 Tax=Marinimicrobium sp. ABcell2 TaxID=3069751 RepID=UPI0027B2B2CC|nr:efflux RND transporter periplasmic adaptor subunit [Marinimicrobium sp. ABcell2]MDQ2075890.1 efflux RND transporter periplasmic adaptor subunit [Marinimicrobium sp. ABcell2]
MIIDPMSVWQRPLSRFTWALLFALLISACSDHHHHADSHEHELPTREITHFTDTAELFLEFQPLIAGERTALVAHFTRLADYRPIEQGHLDVVLSGGGEPMERFRIEAQRAPGIFRPTIAPRADGERELRLVLSIDEQEITHELGTITVHASKSDARRARHPSASTGEIGLYKEQQWRSDFAVAPVQRQPLRNSVSAPARVRAAANGEFVVTAVVSGSVRAVGDFPALGDPVEKGQVLANLVPRTGEGIDHASLDAEQRAARTALELAQATLARVEQLHERGAVSTQHLEEARAEQELAQARLRSAELRLAQLGSEDGGALELLAPLDGIIARVPVAHGAAVDAGSHLFHIVDPRELWLEVLVSEADAGRLDSPSGAAFELPGVAEPMTVNVGDNAQLVGVGSMIDPVSRSLPVIFALQAPDPRLKVNQRVQARIYTGQSREALSIPASAVIQDGGEPVVYVMVSGESFSRRPVRLGARDGDRFEVLEGLAEGERIVSKGAMQVRLAAATPDAMGHGHAH